jgi:hypothetical protein
LAGLLKAKIVGNISALIYKGRTEVANCTIFGDSESGCSEKGLKGAIDRVKPLFTDKSPSKTLLVFPKRSNG